MPHKLGRKPRTFDQSIPHFSSLRIARKAKPVIPQAYEQTAGMPGDFRMMLNDQLGCCVVAEAYHSFQVWSFKCNKIEITEPDQFVEQAYSAVTGYVPGRPETDQGTVMQEFLSYWLNQGLPCDNTVAANGRQKLIAFGELDVRNTNDICEAIYECGIVPIGIQVPSYILPDDAPPPQLWIAPQSRSNAQIVGGHCVGLTGYDSSKGLFSLISWGQLYQMTWSFFQAMCDEAYFVVDPLWISAANNNTPLGLTVAQLEAAMQAIAA